MQDDHPCAIPACAFVAPVSGGAGRPMLFSLGLAFCFLVAQVWLGIG
jgi:hypothetical protein